MLSVHVFSRMLSLTLILRLRCRLDDVVNELVATLHHEVRPSSARLSTISLTPDRTSATSDPSKTHSQFFLKQSWSQKNDPLMPNLPIVSICSTLSRWTPLLAAWTLQSRGLLLPTSGALGTGHLAVNVAYTVDQRSECSGNTEDVLFSKFARAG